jgi:hypothetical protein
MTSVNNPPDYFIGWDVGGWNCKRNRVSRDAIVILDASLGILGTPWRGNLRTIINDSATAPDWLRGLFGLCHTQYTSSRARFTLAIDTPLGFSQEFVALVMTLRSVATVGSSGMNPYLFRRTERYLFERGHTPLSAVKDRIGSQATKGIHALSKFAPKIVRCGVWQGSDALTAVETYPAACNGSKVIKVLRTRYPSLGHEDKEHALTCALVAYLFSQGPQTLAQPPDDVPPSEGWIWVPPDVLSGEAT